MICWVSKMYPVAVICLYWVRDSYYAAHRVWLPCHFSKTLWIVEFLCDLLSSASSLNFKLSSVWAVSDGVSSHANIPLLAWLNSPTTTFHTVSLLLFFTACSLTHFAQRKNYPPIGQLRVRSTTYRMPHHNDRCTFGALAIVDLCSQSSPLSEM